MGIRKAIRELRAALVAMLTLIVVLGVLYPLVVTAIGQAAFPGNANGQLVYAHGRLVGSRLIGQSFALATRHGVPLVTSGCQPVPDARYFQTRPSGTIVCTARAPISVTTPPDNDAGTAFADYGPNSRITEAAIAADISAYIALNGPYYPGGLTAAKVPVDAADTSASGVDPDISVANARIQAYRIAAVRRIGLRRVDALIAANTTGRGLGFSGEPGVDVLDLNLALDRR
ncbi:MAG: potassium-transporting ATPase subunit C [Acidobacteriota bacterium]|nr:potassium-transporting ATPase subunit C [Acidobacteriota bacterium]